MGRRAGVVLLAALAPAAVLAFDPGGLFPFTPAKWLAVSALVPAGLALLLRDRPLSVATRPTAALGALVAVLAVAAVVGPDPLYAWTGTPERHLGVAAWVLVLLAFAAGQSLDGDRDGPAVARGLLVAAGGLGAIGLLEALGATPEVLDAGARLGATLGSPAYLGAAACLLLPPAVVLALDRATPRRPLVVLAASALTAVVIGSGARAAWAGLLAAAAATGWARRGALRAHRVALAGCALAALVALSPAADRLGDAFDPGAPGGAGRLDEWRVATRVLADHPALGVGPEGYRTAFGEGADDAYEREHGRDPLPDRAHSAPLDVALAGGIPALVAWGAVLALVGARVRRALGDDRAWLRGIAAGLVAYVAGQLLLFPLAELEPVAALLAGLVVGATATAAEAPRRRAVAPAGLVALASLAAVALVAGSLDVAADRRAEDAVAALRRGDPGAAHAAASAAADLRPDEVRLHLLVAEAAIPAELGTLAALDAVEAALDRSPADPIALRTRARLLVQRAAATSVPAHARAAIDELERLLADDPSNGQLHLLAALALDLLGDEAGAGRHLARAEALGATADGDGT